MLGWKTRRQWVLILTVLVIPVLACGPLSGKVEQAKEAAETAKQVATAVAETETAKSEPTASVTQEESPEPPAEATETPTDEGTSAAADGSQDELSHLLTRVVKLAPVHATSMWATYKGQQLDEKMRVEMDVDAAGNRRIFIFEGDAGNPQTEIVAVDNEVFFRGGPGEEFISLPGQMGGTDLDFLAIYGAPWLLFFNDVEQATKVGHETVNGFSTEKYDIRFNMMNMGPVGAAAILQGGVFDYKGVAWVELDTKALVKATVDITVKGKQDERPTFLQVRYDVNKAPVAPIKKPTNVLSPPSSGS